jgi:hypothetical protein
MIIIVRQSKEPQPQDDQRQHDTQENADINYDFHDPSITKCRKAVNRSEKWGLLTCPAKHRPKISFRGAGWHVLSKNHPLRAATTPREASAHPPKFAKNFLETGPPFVLSSSQPCPKQMGLFFDNLLINLKT